MNGRYTWPTVGAFVLLVVAYVAMVYILWVLNKDGVIGLETEVNGDVLKLIASLPLVAFYLVVFLAATAGFARAALVMKTIPLTQVLSKELKNKTMESSTIQTKIRSGGQVGKDTSFLRALNNVTSSRLPILAVVEMDPETKKERVTGVVTADDFLRKIEEEADKRPGPNDPSLSERLEGLTVDDLKPRKPTVVTSDQNLQSIIDTMLKEQFTKLIVVEDKQSMKFKGTLDVMDMMGEIFVEDTEA
jgi:CBS domain-containing protein